MRGCILVARRRLYAAKLRRIHGEQAELGGAADELVADIVQCGEASSHGSHASVGMVVIDPERQLPEQDRRK